MPCYARAPRRELARRYGAPPPTLRLTCHTFAGGDGRRRFLFRRHDSIAAEYHHISFSLIALLPSYISQPQVARLRADDISASRADALAALVTRKMPPL